MTDFQPDNRVLSCDVLVVGAGPAGCSAAMTAASMGVDVLVVEKRAQIGVPIRCAEYIPAQLLGETKIEPEVISQSVDGMKTFLPSGEAVETKAGGFIIHRDRFDQHMAKEAVRAGAQIRLSAPAIAFADGQVDVQSETGVCFRIAPRIIIGADGPFSRVGRWMDSINAGLIPAIQARVLLQRPMSCTEVYFHEEIYGGYAWLFPKNREANVGLARKKRGRNSPPLAVLLDRFLDRLTKEGKIFPGVLKTFGGWIPAGPVRVVVRKNMMLVGDAAGQTHSITGAGIASAVICGKMAGKWAAEAVLKNDVTLLNQYQKEWTRFFGPPLQKAWRRRMLLEHNWDRLHDVLKKCWVAFREYYDGF